MKSKLFFVVFAVLVLVPVWCIAGIVEIQPSQDTYVIQSAPDLDCRDRTYVIVKNVTSPLADEARAYIQFDLGSIPPDATIDAAYLYIYQSNGDCGGIDLSLHKVTSTWVDEFTVWNHQPTSNSSVYKRIEGPAPCGWFIIPVTSLVDDWHQGTLLNNGILIRQIDILFPSGGDPRIFNSSEAASDQPKLVVIYNSTSTQVEPDMDAYVSMADPTTNFGTSTDLLLSGSSTGALRSYLQFDLSGIPTGSTIEFARLRLFHYYDLPFGGSGDRAGVYEVTGSWGDSTITWLAQPTHIDPPESYKGAYGDPDFTGRMDWIVTDFVTAWLNAPSTNYGVVVKHYLENLSTVAVTGTFHSSEFGNEIYLPYLEVFYDEPAPNGFVAGQSLPGVFFSDAQWGDLDGDGDNDLVLCGQSDTDIITVTYKNQAGTLVVLPNSLPGVRGDGSGSLALGDYDNDGDLDLALAGQGELATGVIARIYKNNGRGGFTWDTDQVLTGVQRASLAWGDVDNDGDLDLVVQGLDGSSSIATLYLNHPTGTLTADATTTLTGLRNGSVDWADFDNDGDMDLLRTGHDTGDATQTIYSVNNPTGTLTEDGTHGLPGVGMSDAACGDFDRDGWMDVAITGASDGTPSNLAMIYRNIGAGEFAAHTTNLMSVYRSSCAWGDFNNDGRLDVAFCGWSGTQITNIYRCNPAYNFVFHGTFGATREGSLTWVDVDNDTDLDLFVTGSRFTTKLADMYENIGGIPNTQPTPPTALAAFQNFPVPLANGKLHITWSGATDVETTLPGLCYCVRVGTERDFFSATDDVFSGTYGTPLMGNVGQGTTWEISIPYPDRPYYVQIKTIDTGLMASEWSDVFCTWDEGIVEYDEITVDEDAFVSRSYPTTPLGQPTSDIMLAVGAWQNSADIARTYLMFDLPSVIPEITTRVLKAELLMYCTSNPPLKPYWVGVREEQFDSWSETSITWENAPTCFKPGWTGFAKISGPGWNIWDVTRDVKGTIDTPLTLVLMGYNPPEGTLSYVAEFWSKEFVDEFGRKEPMLRIWYSTVTGIGDDTPEPNRFALSQNIPNPFNPDTRVSFTIPNGSSADHVSLKIYDVSGRLVRTLVDEPKGVGLHTVEWNARDNHGSTVASGVYFYRLQWNGNIESKKMVLLR